MDEAQTAARFDWVVELAGALAPGVAAGFAALKLAPSWGVAPGITMTAVGAAGFGFGLLFMRMVRGESAEHALAAFTVVPIEADADHELLLDQPAEQPLLLTDMVEEAFLLDDPLIEAEPDSRVVQLFASHPIPTPGQLKDRIDRHLAGAARSSGEPLSVPRPDASGALYAALDDLRRSLR
jgi:hypothetical protein